MRGSVLPGAVPLLGCLLAAVSDRGMPRANFGQLWERLEAPLAAGGGGMLPVICL